MASAAAALGLFVASAGAAFAQQADLVVNQADAPDPGPAGGVFTYTIRVDNNGPNAATGVNFTDTLPPGSAFVGAATTQGTCSVASGTVSCALGNLAFLANATVTIEVVLPAAGVWTNTATATAATADPNPANNVGIVENTTAQAAADMRLTVADAPDPVAAGANLNYTITARNDGPDPLAAGEAQTIEFTIPAGACIRSLPSGSGWTCTPSGSYPRCSGAISCTRSAALAAGASAPALTVPAVANAAGSLTAAFQVSSPLPDGNPANNTASATTTVAGGSNVSMDKTATPTTVAVGSNVTYTLRPRLNGGEPPGTLAPNLITVTDTLNANLAFVSASGSGWTCSFAAPTLTCTRPGPYTGGNFTNMPAITLVAQVLATGTIPNVASVSAPEIDPVPSNNSDGANVTGSTAADLRLTKAASANPVAPGMAFSYTLTVRNLGPAGVASGNVITVTDTLPAGLELTATPAGSGWACMPNAGFPLAGPVAVTCARSGPLAINTNAPNIVVPVRASVAATHVNNACVELSGTGPSDSVPGNDCASVAVDAGAIAADLQLVSKTASPNPVLAGSDLTYVVTVRNNSAVAATNVTVTDTLGSLVAAGGFQSAVPSQGTCTPSTVTPGPTVNLACNLGTLAAGASATVTIVVRPTRSTTGSRANSASVASPDVGDPVPANNVRSVNSTITAAADLQVSKTATPAGVQAGTPLTYVVTVRNNGPSSAQNVSIVDPLPAGTAFVQLAGVTGAGTCVVPAVGATSGTVSCSFGTIASGSQQTVTFVVRPLGAAGGSVDNTVSATTTTVDPVPANNDFSVSTPVAAAEVDILVNKVDSADPVPLGASTVYTVTVTNAGPSFASNVVLTDSFPAGAPTALFSYQGSLSVAPPGSGTCAEPAPGATSGTLTCTFPGLASGESATVTYAMRAESIASGVSGTVFNTASATADETETLPANNQTEHATTTRRTADLAVAKSAPGTLTPGVPFAWTITITNHGPNDSSGAVLTDALPAGVAFQGASPGCAFAAGTVTCTLGALPSGASIPVTIDVLPSSPYTGANPLSNTATVVTVNEVDPVPTNDSATATIVPGSAVADLSLAKIGPASVLPGAPVRWQLVIANAGPSAAHGTTFSDPLPAGAAGAIASCSGATGGAACGPVGVAGGIVSGTIATLPPGGTLTVIIDATAPPAGALVNTASVTPPVGAADPQPADNTATASTTITALPDLVVAVTASGPFARGQTGATYALLVTNTGAGATTAPVSVDHALPAGLTATAIAGAGWTCTLATLGCTRSDALAAGASFAPITLTVDVALDAPATLVNVASVSGGGESNASNNQATATTNLAPASSPAEAIPALSWASLLGLAALVAAFARRRGLR